MLATTVKVRINPKEQLGFEMSFAFQNAYHFNVSVSLRSYAGEMSRFFSGSQSGRKKVREGFRVN